MTEQERIIAEKDKEIAELKEKVTKLQNQLDGIAKLLNGKKKETLSKLFPEVQSEQICFDGFEPVGDLCQVLCRYYPLCTEHCRVCKTAVNILTKHTAVEFNRRIKIVCFGVQCFLKSALPKLHMFFSCK